MACLDSVDVVFVQMPLEQIPIFHIAASFLLHHVCPIPVQMVEPACRLVSLVKVCVCVCVCVCDLMQWFAMTCS